MEAKEIQTRLEVVRLLISINDKKSLDIQAAALKSSNSSQLFEIAALLEGNNYRQALYLIKTYANEHFDSYSANDEIEKVLDIEDMLRMSPLAQETVNNYRSLAYNQDDLDRFASEIAANNEKIEIRETLETIIEEPAAKEQVETAQEPKESHAPKQTTQEKESKELHLQIESVDKDVPLDEISAEVLGKPEGKSRAKVLSKYKTLRSKFAKHESNEEQSEELKKSSVAQSVISKAKGLKEKINSKKEPQEEKTERGLLEKEEKRVQKPQEQIQEVPSKEVQQKEPQSEERVTVKENITYAAIPDIEKRFREAFALYKPIKESDVWTDEVVRFLKHIAKNSFSEKDVESFLNEYHYYIERNEKAKASQVLLLAAATGSKFAKFTLARELFSGKVVQRNLQRSFTIIKSLANEFYPEAVCDLAQFYEYGIGVPKDKKVALRLYEKAFEVGSTRASKHINRIKESGGFLSSLLKLG